MKEKLITCKACGEQIAKSAKSCPKCGAKNKKPIFKKWWFWLVVIVLAFSFASGDSGDAEKIDTESNSTVGTSTNEQDNVPTEFKNALKRAKIYSDTMHFSKARIYDQLVSEYGDQFPEDAAQYAIDNLVVDWNDNALKSAQNYSDTMFMSKAGIYNQLISEYGEKFTEEQAQYAIDNLNVDWKENALKKAKTYQDTMSMSKNAIYDQLVSEYGEQFTAEEAQYAIDNLE